MLHAIRKQGRANKEGGGRAFYVEQGSSQTTEVGPWFRYGKRKLWESNVGLRLLGQRNGREPFVERVIYLLAPPNDFSFAYISAILMNHFPEILLYSAHYTALYNF